MFVCTQILILGAYKPKKYVQKIWKRFFKGKNLQWFSLFDLFSCCRIYAAFVALIHLNDLLDDVTFLFWTKQKLRKSDKKSDL